MPRPIELISRRRTWRSVSVATASGYVAGRRLDLGPLVHAIDAGAGKGELCRLCATLIGPFAVILKGSGWAFAATDKVRRHPIFYAAKPDKLCIGDDALAVRETARLDSTDRDSLIEFRLAGYVSGRRTLFQGLEQVLAAEYILARDDGTLTRDRYADFPAKPDLAGHSEDDLIAGADAAFDVAFTRTMADANGRPIWVALSAGLDSRIALAKLKALKYDNLSAFTYGAPGNYESKGARYVAQKVGVPWTWLPDTMSEGRRLAQSGTLSALWEASAQLSSSPMTVDTPCLSKVARDRLIPADALILNGQTGDYITGGHVAEALLTATNRGDLYASIRAKHYGLLGPATTRRFADVIDNRISQSLALTAGGGAGQPLWRAATSWEWQERQAKFVVNGQRIYEHFGFDWLLPLWDDEVIDFWSQVGPTRMLRQYLYKTYLERTNLYGVFRDFPVEVWRWPGPAIAAVPAARLAGLLFGEAAKKDVYRIAGYFGHTRYLWAQQGLRTYLRKSRSIRNFHSLNAASVLHHLLQITGCSSAWDELERTLAEADFEPGAKTPRQQRPVA